MEPGSPRSSIKVKGDKPRKEVKLEEFGRINDLQRYRLSEHWDQYDYEPPNISHKLLFVEEDLRELVQEEISIKEGLYAQSEDSKGGLDANEVSKKKLDVINVEYWILAQNCGGPILDGICTAFLLKIVLADKDAVLVIVAVVTTARLILRGSLELDIVLSDVDVVGNFEALTFPKKIRNR
ncbi:uncharacterized protein N7518_000316 [Penicillium psychrosexuale]|uniref:uncharacterized protein n=1 Tax=Penicillium psychrosexuale TaxID=1002107 RepID=UPI002545469B|nr:uncharacterized protein N7518_000316 [Penicillium psychrosexuale]KAJ5804013.1 hypothetical protein N7518_000316 [Penicillium psychrosexuale]